MDIIGTILDGIYGICITVLGLIIMITPYEKFKEAVPKAPSKTVVKVLGAVVVLCGIGLAALGFMGII